MSDSKVQPETSAECSLRDRVLLALACADGQDWASIADASRHTIEIMYGKQADAVLAVRDDVLAEKDAEIALCREGYEHDQAEIERLHGVIGSSQLAYAEDLRNALAEVARLRETVGRAWDDGNATGLDGYVGPGRGTEPVDDEAVAARERFLDAALAPRESATEAPRILDGDPTPRLRACVEAWPDCVEGEYNPSCCRFPKSCSCTVYDPERVTASDLEPRDGEQGGER